MSFLLRRRLRQLQRAYYEAPQKNDAVILEYLRVLAEARKAEVAKLTDKRRALHVGSGGHYLDGWINVDLDPAPPVDAAANLGEAIPFRDASLDYIHSEDFLEHIDLAAGKRFLAEAFRVLKPGGVMRLLTPDLRALVEHLYLGREAKHIAWCKSYLDAEGPCESLNMHLRMNGDHRFIWDEEHLRRVCESIGFRVTRVRYNRSRHARLRYLDLRDFGLNLFVECVKPR